jgi:hypothetical protein
MLAAVALAACGDAPWLLDAHILVDGYDETNLDCRTGPCVHDENTDLTIYDGAIYLVHRTAESQVLGPNSSLRVYRSDDRGATFALLAVIPAPIDRDLRDPCFYMIGDHLAIKAITRLPVTSPRDSNVDSISVNTISADGGFTWTPLVAIGPPTWSFWRVKVDAAGTYYSAAYEDGDKSVLLYSSSDGQTWTPRAVVYSVSEDTPVETELVFFPDGTLLGLVRMDGTDAELLGNQGRLRTKACTSAPPYIAFDCSYELDGARLDGPVAWLRGDRLFVVARRHLIEPEDRKRTALYEITYAAPTGPFGYVDHGDFPSTGDTSYAGVVPLDTNRYLVTYYSSNLHADGPWARALLGPTDIWKATIDLSRLERVTR